MMKQILAIVILIIGVSAVSAQTNGAGAVDKSVCSLTVAQAPEINGVRLGMTQEQVLALFPGISGDKEISPSLAKPPSPLGVSGFTVKPERYESKSKFAGISQITFSLLDSHVSAFSVGYNGPEWTHVDKFVAKFSEGKTLPAPDAWEPYTGMETQLKALKCQDFEIRVYAGGPGGSLNYVQLQDTAADKKLKERRAKAREKAAQESKP